ncbi:MAG: PAS domain S-box protein [Verrucomicrobiota bacterium]|jgi:PAS domain S-box-containing protein
MKFLEPTERRAEWGLLLIFAILSLGIIGGSAFYYRHYERQFRAAAEHQLTAIAELKVNELAQYRKERLEDAAIFFNNAAFSGLVRRFFDHPEDTDAQRQIQTWLGKFQAYYEYTRVYLLDVQGAERLAVPDQPEPLPGHLAKDIAAVLRSGRVTFLDFHRDAPGLPIHLEILVPIFDEQDASRSLGVLVFRINPAAFFYPFIQRWPVPSETAETLLVRRDGDDALFLNELKFRTNTALNLRVSLTSNNMPAVKAILGHEGIVDGTDYRGEPVLAALHAIPDSPWFLEARIDTAEVYAPMRARLWQVVVMICVLLFGSAACVGLVWRQQQSRFYQAQYESAEALRASEVRYRRLFEAARDGILILDAETGMILDVNPFLIELLGYSREAFLGTKVWELGFFKDIVANQDNFEELQQKGYLRYEDLPLETSDGRRIEVEFVSNVYLVNHQKVIQCNIRDITGRKRMEEKLRQLSRAVEQSPASIVITNPAGDIEYANPKFINVTGYTLAEILGKNPRILKSGEISPETYRELWQTITAGKEWRGEFHNKKKNGELYWESASISPIRDRAGRVTHYVAVKEDITARKQNEAEHDQLIQDLHDALANVKSLSGLLPICAGCKKIRDDKGYWSQVESYIQKHSDATFTHGLCPDCIKKLYPDLVEGGLGGSPKEAP